MPASAAAVAGLAFALTLTGGGRGLTSDRFTLRVPGVPGTLTLVVEDPEQYGGTFASPVRLKNELGGDLLAASVEVVSVSETRVDAQGKEATADHAATEGRPPAWAAIRKGDVSSAQLLRAPVAAEDDLKLAILMGRARGVVALDGFELESAPRPAAVLVEPNGTLWVRDASGVIVRTDEKGAYPVVQKTMPGLREKPSSACAALGEKVRLCREAMDGTLVVAGERELTVRDPDGKSRSFPTDGNGAVVAIAFGREGRFYVATGGAEGRPGSIRVFRPF